MKTHMRCSPYPKRKYGTISVLTDTRGNPSTSTMHAGVCWQY